MRVKIEVVKGSFIKWTADGRLDFISPFPSPFHYGSVVSMDGKPASVAADGDPVDALVLISRAVRNQIVETRHLSTVRFIDEGMVDDKWICGGRLTSSDLQEIERFFLRYAKWKRRLNRFRRRSTDVRLISVGEIAEFSHKTG